VVLLPVLRPGFILRYDMLFVPRRYPSLALLGVAEQPPRQVPIDALVGLVSWGVPAAWLEKLLLSAVFVAGAMGAGRLVPSARSGPRVVAGLLYVWNPFVYERLSIGQWSLLLSYAVLPWVAKAALAIRDDDHIALLDDRLSSSTRVSPSRARIAKWSRLGLWLGAASVANPYGGIMAASLTLAVICRPPWRASRREGIRSMITVTGLVAVVSLPWLVPSLFRPNRLPNSAQGLQAFAPRSDSPLGTIGSVLSLGGMWNTSLAPPIRHSWAWIPSFVLLLLAAAFGWWWLRRARPTMTGVLLAGLVGTIASIGTHVPLLGSLYHWVALNVPGGGLFRDAQKFVGLLALVYAVGLGSALVAWTGSSAQHGRVGTNVRGTRSQGLTRSALPLAWALLTISLVPMMAWGLGGRLATTTYPPDWTVARMIAMKDPLPGSILVLPWHPHLPLRWNGGRVTLNPARAFFTRSVLTSDRLELRSGTLPPETPTGAMADALVRSKIPLPTVMRELGARYLLIVKEADWRRYGDRLDGLQTVLDGRTLALRRVTGSLDELAPVTPPASFVLTGDIVAALSLVVMAVAMLRGDPRGRRPIPSATDSSG